MSSELLLPLHSAPCRLSYWHQFTIHIYLSTIRYICLFKVIINTTVCHDYCLPCRLSYCSLFTLHHVVYWHLFTIFTCLLSTMSSELGLSVSNNWKILPWKKVYWNLIIVLSIFRGKITTRSCLASAGLFNFECYVLIDNPVYLVVVEYICFVFCIRVSNITIYTWL